MPGSTSKDEPSQPHPWALWDGIEGACYAGELGWLQDPGYWHVSVRVCVCPHTFVSICWYREVCLSVMLGCASVCMCAQIPMYIVQAHLCMDFCVEST